MTSPLSPESVAQMVADREAAYQSYLNEITTSGNSRLDNIILSLSGNEVQQRHIATQIDMAFQAGWHHMLTTLAAENATLRASEAAAMERVKVLTEAIEAMGAMPEGFCCCSKNRIGDDSKIHESECRDLRAVLEDK